MPIDSLRVLTAILWIRVIILMTHFVTVKDNIRPVQTVFGQGGLWNASSFSF